MVAGQRHLPLCFFEGCVESAVEVADLDEEEEEEEDEEEVVLGKVGMNWAFGSTFNNCLWPSVMYRVQGPVPGPGSQPI